MSTRQEIQSIPDALRATLTEGCPQFEALIRQTRLGGNGPVFFVGSGSEHILGLAGVYAFEGLLGRAAIARPALDFRAYSAGALDAQSLVLAVCQSGESAETLEAAQAARRRGSTVLALTGNLASSLAKMADGVFLVRSGEEDEPRIKTIVCQQAVLGYLAVLAARILKRPQSETAALEREFAKLPGHVEWALTHLQDAARSLASGLKGSRSLSVVGGGLYYPAALQWALLLKKLNNVQVESFAPDESGRAALQTVERDAAVVAISGSRCRLKKDVYHLVNLCRKRGAQVFSLTDASDRELVEMSSLAVLLPVLSEMTGSILALALLDWVAYEIGRP